MEEGAGAHGETRPMGPERPAERPWPSSARSLVVDVADFARGRFPGSRVNAASLEPSPSPGGLEWLGRIEKQLTGYSGGTAQVFDLLPFYPPFMEAP